MTRSGYRGVAIEHPDKRWEVQAESDVDVKNATGHESHQGTETQDSRNIRHEKSNALQYEIRSMHTSDRSGPMS